MAKRVLKSNEGIIACLIIAIVIAYSILSPEFRTINTVFNLTRAMLITSILALPCLLVFIVGGIDLSFMAIASFSMYAVVKIFTVIGGDYPIILMFLVAVLIGVGLGLVNAFFVIITKMPIFIVTLATQFIFSGACLAFVGKTFLQVPKCMVDLSATNLISTVDTSGAVIGINASIVLVVCLYIGIYLMLKYTKFGRTLYAIGGNTESAKRVGINVSRNMIILFALVGGISAIAGTLNGSLLRLAVPGDLVGGELTVIAAVILGGANSAAGKGTVIGTLLGVGLIVLISNSLNLLKVPTYWQEAVIGAVIIIGTIFSAASGKKEATNTAA